MARRYARCLLAVSGPRMARRDACRLLAVSGPLSLARPPDAYTVGELAYIGGGSVPFDYGINRRHARLDY